MRNVRAARRYAVALLAEAAQQNLIEAIADDLEVIRRCVRDLREIRRLLASPVVSGAKKSRFFNELFGPRVHKETLTFLHMLIEKHREALLADIIDLFAELRNETLGLVTVDVTSAVPLAPAQEAAIHGKLEQYTRKKVQVRYALDANIKGGMVVRIGDTVLDGSIKHQLALLRERLVSDQAI